MKLLTILSTPLGFIMKLLYGALGNYGLSLIVFAVLVKTIMAITTSKKMKADAVNSVFQPIVNELRMKYANDQQKLQEELVILQRDYGYKPSSGCLASIILLLIGCGVYGVIYQPLRYLLGISTQTIGAAGMALTNAGIEFPQMGINGAIVGEVINGGKVFRETFTQAEVAKIIDFAKGTEFLGINLLDVPEVSISGWKTLVFPTVALLGFMLPVLLTKSKEKTELNGMTMFTWFTRGLLAWIYFTAPVGFSLYFAVANVLGVMQNWVVKIIVNPSALKDKAQRELDIKMGAYVPVEKEKSYIWDDEYGMMVCATDRSSDENIRRIERARREDDELFAKDRTERLNHNPTCESGHFLTHG